MLPHMQTTNGMCQINVVDNTSVGKAGRSLTLFHTFVAIICEKLVFPHTNIYEFTYLLFIRTFYINL